MAYQGHRVGQYVFVTKNKTLTFPEKPDGCWRVILYGGMDAFGLIGTEYNGIAVLDEVESAVVTDGIAQAHGCVTEPTRAQITAFEALVAMPWVMFREFVNNTKRLRARI